MHPPWPTSVRPPYMNWVGGIMNIKVGKKYLNILSCFFFSFPGKKHFTPNIAFFAASITCWINTLDLAHEAENNHQADQPLHPTHLHNHPHHQYHHDNLHHHYYHYNHHHHYYHYNHHHHFHHRH